MPHDPILCNRNIRVKACRYGPMMYLVNDQYIGQSLDRYGEFSQGEMELMAQILLPGQWAIDVGANIGVHTVFLAQTVGPAGVVFAFEPQRVLYQILCGNVALNALGNVLAHHAGVGSQTGTIQVPPVNYDLFANFGGVSIGGSIPGPSVPLMTIDQLNLRACHFIKIDVEGMESEVIAGATQTINRFRPTLYVENDRAEKSQTLIEQLLKLDYRLYGHFPPMYSPRNFFAEPEDIFPRIVSANMLCIHKAFNQNISGLPEITSPTDSWR